MNALVNCQLAAFAFVLVIPSLSSAASSPRCDGPAHRPIITIEASRSRSCRVRLGDPLILVFGLADLSRSAPERANQHPDPARVPAPPALTLVILLRLHRPDHAAGTIEALDATTRTAVKALPGTVLKRHVPQPLSPPCSRRHPDRYSSVARRRRDALQYQAWGGSSSRRRPRRHPVLGRRPRRRTIFLIAMLSPTSTRSSTPHPPLGRRMTTIETRPPDQDPRPTRRRSPAGSAVASRALAGVHFAFHPRRPLGRLRSSAP
jgi:hypothetical protein